MSVSRKVLNAAGVVLVSALSLLVAEGVARLGRAIVLRHEGLAAEPSRTELSGLTERQWQDYDALPYGDLKPYVMFAPAANYHSATVNTNESGLRGRALRKPKPAGTIRVVVIGGSAAFGTGASSDEATFSARLESMLHERGRSQVEVVNGAAPAFVSGQELARLVFELLDLQPDIAIIYDGFNDLNSPLMFDSRPGYPSNFAWLEQAVQFNSIRRVLSYRLMLLGQESGMGFWARRLRHITSGTPLASPEADAEILRTYRGNLDRMVWLLEASGARVLCTFQPTLLAKRSRTAQEREVITYLAKRHPGYAERFLGLLPGAVATMREVAAARQAAFVNLSGAFDDAAGTIFFDTAHVTDERNRLIAARLVEEVEHLL